MSQNSNTTLSPDSNILFSLNSDCDSREDNEIDLLVSDSEDDEDYNIHNQMEGDSGEETSDGDVDINDVDSDITDMDGVVGDYQDIQWSRKTSFEPDLPVFEKEFMLKSNINLPEYPSPFDFFNLFLTQ